MKHNFKKILSIMIATIMCLSAFPMGALAAEDEVMPKCPICVSNANVVASDRAPLTEPTCTTPAGVWYKCTATHKDTGTAHEFVLPEEGSLAHHSNPEKVTYNPRVEATCNAAGNIEYWHCSVCNKNYDNKNMAEADVVADVTIPQLDASVSGNHKWGAWEIVEKPICGVSDGLEKRVCALNPEHYETRVVEATDHTWDVAPGSWEGIGCLTDATVTLTCACGATKTELAKGWAHQLEKTAASGNTCYEAGNTEYYTCLVCNKYYKVAGAADVVAFEQDDVKYTEIEKDSWIVIAAHQPVHHAAVGATCLTDGSIEYWSCDGSCGKIYADANCTTELTTSTVVAATGHTFTDVAAVTPTCAQAGNVAHKYCAACDKYFAADEADNKSTAYLDYNTEVYLAQLNHVKKDLVEAVAADCTKDIRGQVAYKTCQTCDKLFNAADPDDNLTNEITNIYTTVMIPNPNGTTELVDASTVEGNTIVHQHDWKYEVVKDATCELNGAIVWVCADCDDFTGPSKQLTYLIEKTNHAGAVITEAVAPTCATTGSYAYAYCGACGQYLAVREDGSIDTTLTYSSTNSFVDVIAKDPTNHNNGVVGEVSVDIPAVEPTCNADGNVAFKGCGDCGYFYTVDENGVITNGPSGCPSTLIEMISWIGTIPAEYVVPTTHVATFVEAVAPESCQVAGNIAHYACNCGKLYGVADDDSVDYSNELTAEEIVDATGHNLVDVEKTVDCSKNGLIAHKECTYADCTVKYFTEAGEATTKEVLEMTKEEYIAEYGHTWDPAQHKDPVACTDAEHTGNPGHDVCSICGTSKLLTQHTFTKVVWDEQPTCQSQGKWHYECERCSTKQTDADGNVLVYDGSDYASHYEMGFTHVARVEKTCFTNGNIEYWICKECGEYFAHASMLDEDILVKGAYVADGGEVIPASHSNVSAYNHHVGGCDTTCNAETCTIAAHWVAQYQCADCNWYSMTADFKSAQETPYGASKSCKDHCTQTKFYADSTCLAVGQKDVWTCDECGTSYLEATCVTEVKDGNDVIAIKSHNGTLVNETPATCTKVGEKAHFTACTNGCGKIYGVKDGKLDTTVVYTEAELVIPMINHKTGALTEAVESVCTVLGSPVTDGNIAYYTCTVCNAKFDATYGENPAAGTPVLNADSIKDQTPHVPHFTEVAGSRVDSTCTEEGYYVMACDCGYDYYQFTAPLRHNVVAENTDSKAPDCDDAGWHEYYYCENCKKSYTDADCTIPTTDANGKEVVWDCDDDAVIPATGKHFNAAGHEILADGNMVDGVKVPACAVGLDRDCVTCDADFTVAHATLVEAKTEASCKYPESTYMACPVCHWIDESTRVVTKDQNGIHPENALIWVEVTPADCENKGLEKQHCELCDTDTGFTRDIAKKDHNFAEKADGSNVDVTPAEDCTKTGLKVITCQNGCGKTKEVVLPAGKHVMTEWAFVEGVTLENAYTVEVAQERHCKNCDKANETRSMQDILFTIDVDNAVVSGAGYVNSGKVAVKINVSAYKQMAVLNAFTLKFNYENLTYAGIDYGTFADKFAWKDVNAADGTFTIMVMPATLTNVDVDGQDVEFITVYFNIDADAPTTAKNSFTVGGLEIVECINAAGDDVTNITCGAGVTETYGMLGDVDGNGQITLRDAQLIMAIFQGTADVTYSASADFDKNGAVQVADFAAIRKHISGAYTYAMLVNPELRPAS